jgi:hypothetical protein
MLRLDRSIVGFEALKDGVETPSVVLQPDAFLRQNPRVEVPAADRVGLNQDQWFVRSLCTQRFPQICLAQVSF